MARYIDITGQTFGRLTAVRRVENDGHGNARWLFRCACGVSVVRVSGTIAYAVRAGTSPACAACGKRSRSMKGVDTLPGDYIRFYIQWRKKFTPEQRARYEAVLRSRVAPDLEPDTAEAEAVDLVMRDMDLHLRRGDNPVLYGRRDFSEVAHAFAREVMR